VSGAVATAARLVLFPVGAAAAGAALAAWRAPGEKVTSGVHHFAAGVVFAAVAGEILPDLRGGWRLGRGPGRVHRRRLRPSPGSFHGW